jgi:FtsZ-binding cell division protein ZapB
MTDIVFDAIPSYPVPNYAYTPFFSNQDAGAEPFRNAPDELPEPMRPSLPPRKQGGTNRVLILGLVILLIVVGFQQMQIDNLKDDLKSSRETVANLSAQIRNLQSQNDQIYDILRQFESRIGYVDNKVEHVIEDNVEKEHRLQAVQAERAQEQLDPEPSSTPGNRGNVLKEIFGNLFR